MSAKTDAEKVRGLVFFLFLTFEIFGGSKLGRKKNTKLSRKTFFPFFLLNPSSNRIFHNFTRAGINVLKWKKKVSRFSNTIGLTSWEHIKRFYDELRLAWV